MKDVRKLTFALIGIFAFDTLFVALFKSNLGYMWASILSSSIIIAIFIFTPLQRNLTKLVSSIFYSPNYDYQKVLRESVKALVTILDLDKLLAYFLKIIVDNMKPARAAIFLLVEEKGIYKPFGSYNIDKNIIDAFVLDENESSMAELKNKRAICLRPGINSFSDKNEHGLIFSRFDPLDTEIIVPFFYKERLVGILSLGKRSDGAKYSRGDMEILDALSNEAAIAIENARLYTEAITDGLTRLYHHKYFQHRLLEEVERTKRYHGPLSLIMFDIDNFKEFNDKYGHQAGDIILRDIGKILKTSLRVTDIPARYGGEEFAVILPSTPKEGALIAAERIRAKVQGSIIKHRDNNIGVTISCGISEYDGTERSFTKEQLIREADVALYKAKKSGRNRVEIFSAVLVK